MKNAFILFIFLLFVGGCAVPMYALSPYTTASGDQRWRFVSKGIDEQTKNAAIESEIGKQGLCPNGWTIESKTPGYNGSEIIEGQCKK